MKLAMHVIRHMALALAVVVLMGAERSLAADAELRKITVQLPTSAASFPAGQGADIANSQCLSCHSAGMVLTQPKRSEPQWKATIAKMRDAYGAPLPVEQVEPLAVYLTHVIDGEPAGEQVSSSAEQRADAGPAVADGASVFASNCAMCHQVTGMGIPGAFPALAGSSRVNGRDTVLVQILLHGLQGSISVGSTTYNGVMPPFASQLSDAQIASVLTYIRGEWGNHGAAVDATLVRAQRATTAARNQPWDGEADLRRIP